MPQSSQNFLKGQEAGFLRGFLPGLDIFLKHLLCIKSQKTTDDVSPFLRSGREAKERSRFWV